MRKINLKTLSSDEILTREELVKIIGGNGSEGSCGETDIGCERDGTFCKSNNLNCVCEWVQSEPQSSEEEPENFLVCMDFS